VILTELRATVSTAIHTALQQIQLVQAFLSSPAPSTPDPVATPKPALPRRQYDVHLMMMMAASSHSATSMFDTRDYLEANDLDFLLNSQEDQSMHEDYVDDWCDYALIEEEERMLSSLPQKFRQPSPPRRYSSSCVEVKMGKICAGTTFERRGTPARAPFRPLRQTPPSWATKHKH